MQYSAEKSIVVEQSKLLLNAFVAVWLLIWLPICEILYIRNKQTGKHLCGAFCIGALCAYALSIRLVATQKLCVSLMVCTIHAYMCK